MKDWWAGEIDWATPAGRLLQKLLAALPKGRPFHVTVYGSAPLQLTVDRLFERVIELTGHPSAEELKQELQNAVDLFRPAFDEDSPNRYPENTRRLWREIFHAVIDIRRDIVEPAIVRRRQGYGDPPPDYKSVLDT